MPAPTDVEERVAVGICAIVEAMASLQALMGRGSNLIIARNDWARVPEDIPLPLVAYAITSHTEIGGAGDNRRFVVTLDCFAREAGAGAAMDPKQLTRHMVEALELGITQPALAGQGLDAAPMRRSRPPVPADPEGTEGLQRSTIEFELWMTK
jgi:hypothetical protein